MILFEVLWWMLSGHFIDSFDRKTFNGLQGNIHLLQMCSTYIFVLVNHIHAPRLKFPQYGIVSPHGRPNQDIVQSIAIQITGFDTVPKICSNLITSKVVQVCKI